MSHLTFATTLTGGASSSQGQPGRPQGHNRKPTATTTTKRTNNNNKQQWESGNRRTRARKVAANNQLKLVLAVG